MVALIVFVLVAGRGGDEGGGSSRGVNGADHGVRVGYLGGFFLVFLRWYRCGFVVV